MSAHSVVTSLLVGGPGNIPVQLMAVESSFFLEEQDSHYMPEMGLQCHAYSAEEKVCNYGTCSYFIYPPSWSYHHLALIKKKLVNGLHTLPLAFNECCM